MAYKCLKAPGLSFGGKTCMCITNSKKSLVVKQKKYSRTTVDNDDSGIWDLHLIAGALQSLRFSPEEINIKTDKWPTDKPESCRKKSKEPKDDVRPHGRNDKRKYHTTTALWQLCNTQKAHKHYHSMIIIHLWDS